MFSEKKVSVIVKFNKMMIISTLVVADKSGYAVICSFNEGVRNSDLQSTDQALKQKKT